MDVRYTNDNYQFLLRVSTLIFNEDESKVLLFNVTGRSFYMLPGGKINELEESIDAIKREVKEELGWKNLEYKFLGISEEFVNDKGYNNHQINWCSFLIKYHPKDNVSQLSKKHKYNLY